MQRPKVGVCLAYFRTSGWLAWLDWEEWGWTVVGDEVRKVKGASLCGTSSAIVRTLAFTLHWPLEGFQQSSDMTNQTYVEQDHSVSTRMHRQKQAAHLGGYSNHMCMRWWSLGPIWWQWKWWKGLNSGYFEVRVTGFDVGPYEAVYEKKKNQKLHQSFWPQQLQEWICH